MIHALESKSNKKAAHKSHFMQPKELMHLQLMLKSKMEVIADRYEREVYRKDRYEWMQLMASTYKAPPKRDYPM